ncbi:unnamed protein product [Moneuplotes crassus]|uniref:Uncharacterized protein n=1 Tax=Euplotes crassus TaxID=5936 RepID=A0AAD1XWS9_EUPCR|nr:unnamed protein product [Moneuplotes crassus]
MGDRQNLEKTAGEIKPVKQYKKRIALFPIITEIPDDCNQISKARNLKGKGINHKDLQRLIRESCKRLTTHEVESILMGTEGIDKIGVEKFIKMSYSRGSSTLDKKSSKKLSQMEKAQVNWKMMYEFSCCFFNNFYKNTQIPRLEKQSCLVNIIIASSDLFLDIFCIIIESKQHEFIIF